MVKPSLASGEASRCSLLTSGETQLLWSPRRLWRSPRSPLVKIYKDCAYQGKTMPRKNPRCSCHAVDSPEELCLHEDCAYFSRRACRNQSLPCSSLLCCCYPLPALGTLSVAACLLFAIAACLFFAASDCYAIRYPLSAMSTLLSAALVCYLTTIWKGI